MKLTQDFKSDLAQLLGAYARREPFAFVRFGDGEGAILRRRERAFGPSRPTETWRSTDVSGELYVRLHQSLTADLDGYYVGVICPRCSQPSTEYLRPVVKAPLERHTYAELLMNSNYNAAVAFDWGDYAAVTSGRGDYKVPINWTTPWDLDGLVTQLLAETRPILVAAGPAANIIVHEYWVRQPAHKRVPILDIGSLFDPLFHDGAKTRETHNTEAREHNRTCTWDGQNTDPPRARRTRRGRIMRR